MEFEIAELALDHQDAGPHLGVLERDVGERLDVEARRHLDDLRGIVGARQVPAHPGGDIGERLGLQLVDEDEGSSSAMD